MNRVLGLVGRYGVGRRTIGLYLREQYGVDVLRFTDAVFAEMGPAFDIHDDELEAMMGSQDPNDRLAPANCKDPEFRDICKREYFAEARQAGVYVGPKDWLFAGLSGPMLMHYWMNYYRIDKQGGNYWLERMQTKVVMSQTMGHENAVITDCSHSRHMEYIKRGGMGQSAKPFKGTMVRVRRQGVPASLSEANVDFRLVDRTIDNDGSIADLASTVDSLLVDIGWSPP